MSFAEDLAMTKARTTAAILVLLSGCGNSGGPAIFPLSGGTAGSSVPTGGSQTCGSQAAMTGPNVLDVIVDPGPPGLNSPYINGLFATATICDPGTSNCQTIDHLLVDTGSVGVRVIESLLTLSLPNVTNASGQNLAECAPFVDSSAWGPLKTADVRIGSNTAAGLTIQLVGENTYPLPTSCAGTGPASIDVQTLGANGFLGVGVFLQDCGTGCALSARSPANPGAYYACSTPTGGCAVASVPTSLQVSHPVAAFPADNNGVIIQLPCVSASGAPSVPGQLIFGIGTQSNNGLGSAAVFTLDAYGDASTTFPIGGTAYTSFIDSGSNGIFFLDSATSKLPQCTDAGNTQWYCPSSTTNLSATLAGATGGTARVNFSVGNAARVPVSASAFYMAGPMPGYFDWGLPFFFGRAVYTAIENQSTPAGVGPYVAF
jgi:hypothetical protein